MKRVLALFLCLCLFLPLFSCTKGTTTEQTYFAFDTAITVRIIGKEAKKAQKAIRSEIEELDARFSAYQDTSELRQLETCSGQWTQVSKELFAQLEIIQAVQSILPDAFSPFLRPLSEAWGFLDETLPLPTDSQISSLVQTASQMTMQLNAENQSVWLSPGATLDLGAIAKGYIGTLLTQTLSQYELTGAYLSLGGNIQLYRSKKDGEPWKIGIADPTAPAQVLGVLQTDACAVVTSGSYQRYRIDTQGDRYHHILDPKTGYPARSGLSSVTVLCQDGAWADALSTAFFVAGKEQAVACWKSSTLAFECIFVTDTNEVFVTEGISASFSLSDSQRGFTTILRE